MFLTIDTKMETTRRLTDILSKGRSENSQGRYDITRELTRKSNGKNNQTQEETQEVRAEEEQWSDQGRRTAQLLYLRMGGANVAQVRRTSNNNQNNTV